MRRSPRSRWAKCAFRSASPTVKTILYLNTFASTNVLGTAPNPPYPSDAARDLDGTPYVFPEQQDVPMYGYVPAYDPTTQQSNAFGAAIESVYLGTSSGLVESVQADGIFWDQIEASDLAQVYGATQADPPPPGDGLSTSIVSDNTAVIGHRYAWTTLASLSYRARLLDQFVQRGYAVIGNGQPYTETMIAFKILRFVETAGAVWATRGTHLFCPIALGVPHFGTAAIDPTIATEIRERLDAACLYYAYRIDPAQISNPGLLQVMFPFTPVDIAPGVMIGTDRILISRPGRFGWGDGTQPYSIRIFNDRGVELDVNQLTLVFETEYSVKLIEYHDDGTVAVALPNKYTAALMRHSPAAGEVSLPHFNYYGREPRWVQQISDPGGPVERNEVRDAAPSSGPAGSAASRDINPRIRLKNS